MLAWALGIAAAIYLTMIGLMVVFQRAVVFRPGSWCPSPAEAGLPEMNPVPVRTGDGVVITGWYAPPARSNAGTVVLFQGNAGTLADRAAKARVLLDAGFGLFLVGYRGYGGNPGTPSEQGLYADGRAVLAWLSVRGVPPNRLALYGESLGSGVAVQLAGEQSGLGALILEAPFTRLAELAPPIIGSSLAGVLMSDHFDNLAKIRHIATPLLVIHGEQDDIVPAAMGRRLLAAAPAGAEGMFPPQAGHNDPWRHGADLAVLDFLTPRIG